MGTKFDDEKFLTVSMNADARIQAMPEWRERFSEEAIDRWHLDLRSLAQGSHVEAKNLREARNQTFAFLESHGIRGHQGKIELFARAKLSFLMWLGWEMRFVPRIVGLNYYAGTFRRFEQPEPVLFQGNSLFRWLRPEPPLQANAESRDVAGSAILLVDAFGRSTPEQLARFESDAGASPVRAGVAHRLVSPPGEVMQPGDLRPFLSDVVETLGQLRRDKGVTRLHLGVALPDIVAFFLGRQLNASGMEILLYEFFDTGYRYVFRLDRNEP